MTAHQVFGELLAFAYKNDVMVQVKPSRKKSPHSFTSVDGRYFLDQPEILLECYQDHQVIDKVIILAHELGHHLHWQLLSQQERRILEWGRLCMETGILPTKRQFVFEDELLAWEMARQQVLAPVGFTGWERFEYLKKSALVGYRYSLGYVKSTDPEGNLGYYEFSR